MKKTVLIATTIPEIQKRFASALQDAGNQTVSINKAVALFASLSNKALCIDLVILDFRLALPGIRTAKKIRKLDSDVPIIIFSGSINNAADVRSLSELGITRYINENCATKKIIPSLVPQLYPDNFNRRTNVRVSLGIPIALRIGDSLTAALTLNLGKGGVGVCTMNPLDVGIKVNTQFKLPASQKEIDAVSRVVWSDYRAGMGLQFEEVEMSDQSTVDEFIDKYLFKNKSD
jgi:CheY-like chemotaxis protein